MPPSVRTIEVCIDRYGRLTRIERSGRFYEICGVRYLYLLVACLFGETALPDSRQLVAFAPAGMTHEAVRGHRDRTLYYEVSNLVIFLCYLPLLALTWELRSRLVVYASILCVLHGALIVIERYKRALYGLWLDHMDPGSETETPSVAREVSAHAAPASASNPAAKRPAAQSLPAKSPAPAAPGGFVAWYFRPHRFETERLYRALGLETVRGWVVTFTRLTAVPPDQRHLTPRSISGNGLTGLRQFDHETRVSEVSHLIGILLESPFLALFIVQRVPLGLVYIASLIFLNASFVLLQRATRVRVWRVLSKRGVSRQ